MKENVCKFCGAELEEVDYRTNRIVKHIPTSLACKSIQLSQQAAEIERLTTENNRLKHELKMTSQVLVQKLKDLGEL